MIIINQILDDHGIDDPFEQIVLSNEIYFEVTGIEYSEIAYNEAKDIVRAGMPKIRLKVWGRFCWMDCAPAGMPGLGSQCSRLSS